MSRKNSFLAQIKSFSQAAKVGGQSWYFIKGMQKSGLAIVETAHPAPTSLRLDPCIKVMNFYVS